MSLEGGALGSKRVKDSRVEGVGSRVLRVMHLT